MARFAPLATAASVATVVTALDSPALAQTDLGNGFAPTSPVAVVVKVPTPWYAPKFFVTCKMRDTISLYQSLQGLNFKAFSFARADGHYGGVYLWKNVASAKAWFTPAWFARVERERRVQPAVRFFEVALALDNTPGGTPSDRNSPAVVAIVEIPIPPGISKDKVVEGFAASVPTYREVPGLLRKYFITTPQGKFGGIYLWKDEASANAWFSDAWNDRIKREYGQAPTVEWFDTPILLVGKESNGTWIKGNSLP